MLNLIQILLAFFLLTLSQNIYSNETDCIEAQRDRSIAITLRDYPEMIRTADKTMSACASILSKKSINDVRSDKVTAYIQMKKYKKGLIEANKCISEYFSTPICHYWKAVAYRDILNYNEYKKAKDTGISICNHIITNQNKLLESALNNIDKKNVEADIGVAYITLENLNSLDY
jgi:hypothetical protein